ncbi:MAG: 50S ribosomal protein L10 [Desulfovibrionales bacterium]|nr:MAG: 50S ribosomal protein L10 [Desulfovibrionales bacterium]
MNRTQKSEIIEKLRSKASTASIAIVTDFKGLKVEEVTPLRVKLRESGIDYHVVKNTLARIALNGTQHDVLNDSLKDCCAIAFTSGDPVSAAKIIVEFEKGTKNFSTRFASLEGTLLSSIQVDELAKLPGKEVLLAKALGTMNAVPTNFVGLFANILRNFLYALNGIKDQKEQSQTV